MKIKASILAASVFSIAFSMGVSATPISSTAITPILCPVLADNVTLNLSTRVKGAYTCNEVTNSIKIATCHESGSRKARTGVCAGTPSEDDPDVMDWNLPGCTSAGQEIVLGPDYKGFYAITTGGAVVDKQLGGNCTDATVGALVQ
ncbi:MAG: hypothetical protein KJ890_04475 [Gammaproteobacteria bacterium]|nr:hypothetical protein [Gammaproteobacteria bacterium]MBU0813199.1 hypothetical protein [Gammaproteobacteria bacterium]MBU1774492.1 hypothetical protein [Gammaproteobacteria bacterium]|tara:strand:- start:1511 stop:1948 length:438 start_codon:yes stop_codon:yes gene_type:complete